MQVKLEPLSPSMFLEDRHCTMYASISEIKSLVACCLLFWIALATEAVVLKSLSTRSASECCTVCDQTQTCQGVSYEEQLNVCKIRGSLEEIPDWVLIPERDTTSEAAHHFVKDRALQTTPLCGHYLVSGEHCVTDQQMSASTLSENNNYDHGAHRGRLFTETVKLPNGTRHIGAWAASVADKLQYIQVKFNVTRIVRGIATQGRNLYKPTNCCYYRVTKYRALYSLDCTTFHPVKDSGGNDKIFPGNTDQDSVVTNTLDSPVLARCFRINPVSWKTRISMRFDVLGCVL